MQVTRRGLVKVGAAAGAAAAVTSLFSVPSKTLEQVVQGGSGSGPNPEAATLEEWVPTTCWIGKQDCGMLARKVNGRVVKFEGNPAHPRNKGTLCPKGVGQITALYDPNRVTAPLIRTNSKGVPGEFRSATWDEALTLLAGKIKETRAKDPRQVLWQKGRTKQEAVYDNAFVKTLGAVKVGHGAYCSDAGYRAAEYTLGLTGNAHPDFKHTRYVLCWGWNLTNAGGNKMCFITWNQQLTEARERGLKVVVIDPSLRGAGPFADEWLPIKPGTDLALAMAFCNVLLSEGFIDKGYLTQFTNSPFLVQDDGSFLRVDGKEQVWDEAAKSAQPFDAKGVQPALEGEFQAQGKTVKPAFQLFREHVVKYTPEWAADICGLKADVIRRIGHEIGQNAMIGSTIQLEGMSLPYRPVGLMAYHMSQQELGFQAFRAMYSVMMLVGAVEAVGGLRVDSSWKLHPNFEAFGNVKIKDPPYDYTLADTKFFPIRSANPGMIAKVMMDPQKYGVEKLPEVMIVHMANPLASFTDQPLFMESYKKFKFIAVLDPWLSRTADYFADVILPVAAMEKYEGPISASDMYTDATVFRLPVTEPMGQSRDELDIYLGLCEKLDLLTGKDGYLDRLNVELALKDPYKLDVNGTANSRGVADAWCKSQGLEGGIKFFEKNGVWAKGPVSAKKYYGYAASPPFSGIRQRLYGEALLRYQKEMKAKGAAEIYWRDYTALPAWRDLTFSSSPPQYDLTLISYKKVEFKQGRTSQLALVAELAPRQWLAINPATAKAKRLKEGDPVWVEAHNALTGETRKVQTVVALTEAIRPDVVGMPHHYGEIARHPVTKGQGPTPNTLFFAGEGYMTNTADNTFHVRVRVYKA